MITDVSAGFIRRLIGFAEHPLPLPSGCQKNHSTPASFWFFPLSALLCYKRFPTCQVLYALTVPLWHPVKNQASHVTWYVP